MTGQEPARDAQTSTAARILARIIINYRRAQAAAAVQSAAEPAVTGGEAPNPAGAPAGTPAAT